MENRQKFYEQIFKEELRNQYRKSLYWYSLPTLKAKDRVDAAALYPSDDQFPNRWIRQVLETTNPSSEVKPEQEDAAKLKSIYYEHRCNPQKKIGFGYPTLVMKDSTEQQLYVTAPLFIWSINIEALSVEEDYWRIFRSSNMLIKPNELLIGHLEKQGIDLRSNFEAVIVNGKVDEVALQKLCNDIAVQLDFNTDINTLSLSQFPKESSVRSISDVGEILWSGVVGLFEFMPNDYLKRNDETTVDNEEVEVEEKSIQDFRKHGFTSYKLDPYQAGAMRGLTKHHRIAVEGSTYTGIYNFVGGTAINTLSNGGKVLIISKQASVLNQVAKSINTHLEANFAAVVLHDLEYQKEVFYTILRQITDTSKRHLPFDEQEYQLLVNVSNRLQTKLDLMHDALNKPIFKNKVWIELIGEFLKNHEIEGRQLLNSQLLSTDYSYDEDSYEALKGLVLKGKALYQNVNTLRHPLEVLHQDIFSTKDKETAKSFTKEGLDRFTMAVGQLYHQYVLQIEEYGQALQGLYEKHHDNLSFEATDLEDFIADNLQRFGDDFNKKNIFKNLKLKLFSLFSDKYKTILEAKQSVVERYHEIETEYYNSRYFEYTFADVSGANSFDKIIENLKDLKLTLRNWKQDFPVIIHNEIQRLSPHTIHPDLDYQANLSDLNEQLNIALSELNEVNLLTQDFGTDEPFLINNKTYLERIMDQLESLNFNLRDFDDYYDWKNFWIDISEENRKLLKAFITTKPENWSRAFDSWFIHQVLSQYQDEHIPNADNLFHQYFLNHEQLTNYIPRKIDNHWTYRRSSILRDFKRDFKTAYNTYFGKRTGTELFDVPLDEFLWTYRDTVLNVIPVFCTTPEIAANFLENNSYETVIILEADSIALEEGYQALNLGNEVVVCGSSRRKRIGNSETLMEYAQNNYKSFKLRLESEHKQLYSEFINRAFHRGRLNKGIDVTPTDYSLQIRLLKGHFNERMQYNEDEVTEMINMLIELHSDNARYLPKVGIVCFTMEQRNLVLERFSHIQKHKLNGHQVIGHFFRNGMTICTLEDVVGKNFDVTFVSTTFSNNLNIDVAFNNLSTEEGQYWIYHLLNSGNSAIHVCTSLTKEFIADNRFNYKNHGLLLLCTFIDFVLALQNEGIDKAKSILSSLHATYNESKASSDLMVSQAIKSLVNQLGQEQVVGSSKYDIAKVDFSINSKYDGVPATAVVIDSFFWQFPKGDYYWDKLLRETVNKQGLRFQPSWSVEWWKYPEKVPQLLAESVRDFEKEFVIEEVKEVADDDILESEIEEVTEQEEVVESIIETSGEATEGPTEEVTEEEK